MLEEIGLVLEGIVETDSSAGLGMSSKVGLQKTKHIVTKYLRIKQAVRQQRLKMRKIDGASNPADLPTKHVDYNTMMKHMRALGLEVREGWSKFSLPLLDGATRVRVQMVLMTLMVAQQLGEGNGMKVAMTLRTSNKEAAVWSETSTTDQGPSNWRSVLMTVLMIAGWEIMKLLMDAMVQEKLIKVWNYMFEKKKEQVPEIENQEDVMESGEIVEEVQELPATRVVPRQKKGIANVTTTCICTRITFAYHQAGKRRTCAGIFRNGFAPNRMKSE